MKSVKNKKYRYDGSKPFTFIYEDKKITLRRKDVIHFNPEKLTSKLIKVLTEIE